MDSKIKKDRDWSEYPIGTKAWAIMGGHWEKVSGPPSGWKWCTGDAFPTPGADVTGYITLPDPHEAEVRRIAESLTRIMHPIAYADRSRTVQDGRLWLIKLDFHMDAARAMVAEMANTFKYAFHVGYNTGHLTPDTYDVDELMIERGLIPSPTKTGA